MQEHVIRFLHTRDGSKASVLSIGYGSPKERKIITKSLKGYITKICKEEFGHFLILSIFTFVDDVVLVKNSILKEMMKGAVELCMDKYGRLSFLAILKGLTKSYFDPFTISLLEPKMMPDPANPTLEIPTSKKTPEKRKEELLQAILGDLILLMGDAQVMYKLVTDTYGSAVVKETIEQVKDETAKKKLVDSLLVWVNFEPPKAESERKYHPLEEKPAAKEDIANHPVAHLVLKRLIKKRHRSSTNGVR